MDIDKGRISVDRGTLVGNVLEGMDALYQLDRSTAEYGEILELLQNVERAIWDKVGILRGSQ